MNNDQMDISVIYTEFHRVLLGFIKTKVSNHQDAEDILQDVFIKVAAGIDDLSRKEKLQSWLYTIARNAITDYYRKKANKKSLTTGEDVPDIFSEDEYNDTTKALDGCVNDLVNRLPGEYRDIIIDVEMKDVKQKDLVEKYNLAYPSIRSRVQRGREKLKQIFLNCCHIECDIRGNILNIQPKAACTGSHSEKCK